MCGGWDLNPSVGGDVTRVIPFSFSVLLLQLSHAILMAFCIFLLSISVPSLPNQFSRVLPSSAVFLQPIPATPKNVSCLEVFPLGLLLQRTILRKLFQPCP